MRTVEKTIYTIEALNILAWTEDENGIFMKSKMPLKVMWELRKLITKLNGIREQYNQFEMDMQKKYSSDEYSYEKEETNENGETETLRVVKEDCLGQFNQERQELLFMENKVTVPIINIELFGDVEVSIQDMNILSLFIEDKSDEEDKESEDKSKDESVEA